MKKNIRKIQWKKINHTKIIILPRLSFILFISFIFMIIIIFFPNRIDLNILYLPIIITAFISLIISHLIIPSRFPDRIGLSKNKLHLRYKNEFYNIDINKNNIDKIIRNKFSFDKQIKVCLKTGTIIKLIGSKEIMNKIIKILN